MNRTVDPDVSVVMSVYNGEKDLRRSIESILEQEGVEFEFIIVDDGSSDGSAGILAEFEARDGRVRVIRQTNQGLTKALIRGCAEARGNFIARQDCGDVSLPSRLVAEFREIKRSDGTVFVSCGTRFVGPEGEFLFDVVGDSTRGTESLLTLDARLLAGPPCHPCVMFRRSSYERVGGYRAQFEMAQDIDLWVRLIENGRYNAVSEVLYEYTCSLDGISAGRSSQQRELLRLIADCARLRRSNQDESLVLSRAKRYSQMVRRGRRSRGQAAYFVGACLVERNPERARTYFKAALRENPFHMRALLRYIRLLGLRG